MIATTHVHHLASTDTHCPLCGEGGVQLSRLRAGSVRVGPLIVLKLYLGDRVLWRPQVPWRWRQRALCVGTDVAQFVPDEVRPHDDVPPVVLDLCRSCPVRSQCEEYGRLTGSSGWWGGALLRHGRSEIEWSAVAPPKPTPKLNFEIAEEIRHRRAAGETTAALSEEYGIGRQQVWAIVKGYKWKAADDRTRVQRLTMWDADEIRRRYAEGVRSQELADEFGVSRSYIHQIIRGRHWRQDRHAR